MTFGKTLHAKFAPFDFSGEYGLTDKYIKTYTHKHTRAVEMTGIGRYGYVYAPNNEAHYNTRSYACDLLVGVLTVEPDKPYTTKLIMIRLRHALNVVHCHGSDRTIRHANMQTNQFFCSYNVCACVRSVW